MNWTAQGEFRTNVLSLFVRSAAGALVMGFLFGCVSFYILVKLLVFARDNALEGMEEMAISGTDDALVWVGSAFGISLAFGSFFATMHGLKRAAIFLMSFDILLSLLGGVLPNLPEKVPATTMEWVFLGTTMLVYFCLAVVPPIGVYIFSSRVKELTDPGNDNNVSAKEIYMIGAEVNKIHIRRLKASVKMKNFTKKQRRELKKMSLDEQESFFRKPPAEQTKYFADKKGGAFNLNFNSRKTGS